MIYGSLAIHENKILVLTIITYIAIPQYMNTQHAKFQYNELWIYYYYFTHKVKFIVIW